jgi:hypothetical protein
MPGFGPIIKNSDRFHSSLDRLLKSRFRQGVKFAFFSRTIPTSTDPNARNESVLIDLTPKHKIIMVFQRIVRSKTQTNLIRRRA